VLLLMAAKARDDGVRLEAELSPDVATIMMDPDGIQRCLMNLVGNAIDACRDNAAGGHDKRVALRTVALKEGGVEYQVVDNGCGMDDDVQQRLFQSFFSTKGTEGTGIGLMMTKRIVDQHQGVVEVKSRPGEGTTVIIRLPAGSETINTPWAARRRI
jgi:signal transduction histidine kinase